MPGFYFTFFSPLHRYTNVLFLHRKKGCVYILSAFRYVNRSRTIIAPNRLI